MLIPDAFLTDEIRATDDYAEYETVFVKSLEEEEEANCWETSSLRKSLKVTIRQKKQSTTTIPPLDDDQERDDMVEATLLSLTLHKTALAAEAQENVAKVQEKLEDEEIEKMVKCEEDEESYASEFVDSMLNDDNDDSGTRIDPMSHKEHPKNVDDDDEIEKEKKDDKMIIKRQISPRKKLSSDKTFSQELTDTVSPSNAKTSKGYMIQRMKKKYVTGREFLKVHGKVNNVLHEIIPQIAEKATNDFIKAEVPALVSKEFANQAPQIIEELFKNYVSNNMKYNLQDQATNPTLSNVLKRKFEKYYTPTTSCRHDAFRPHHHDEHQEDHAPSEGEKKAKRHKTSKSLKSSKSTRLMDGDEVILEDTTLELIDEFQNVDKYIPTIYDYARMMDTLNAVMSNQFKDAEEYAYHLEQTKNYMENQIAWKIRQVDIK
ncbi:hypothetical protein Tco_0991409 [Tanacetum coccineum]|uniref:Uncharacterized protein n=1 Tax=Tanacetum coccineum TaxID=301880 RepID=A0ABQ5F0E5_9ASTR